MIGKTLGHYRVGEQLGRGGMGEVYLADDLNLNRKVALKFLPDAFTGDPERMARFEREAKLLASLNHPNIAAIYGLEQAEGKRFLVLELVEGETLAQRLSKGPLPVEEALGICRQIAEGLEAAHEKGVIHRDLKPANVMITGGDKVKILDFGLAKALSDETQSVDSSQSPTLTEAMTRPGVILGTAAYMSPEQAKGKSVDKRADIWAFGCILYECLTGKRVFEGETVTETLAAVLKNEPDWQALPAGCPIMLLRRCLERDAKRRLRDIGDAVLEAESVTRAASGHQPIYRQPLVWALASQEGDIWMYDLQRPGTRARLTRQTSNLEGDNLFPMWSCDGKRIYFQSNRTGDWDIYSQPADGSQPAEVLLKRPDNQDPRSMAPDGTLLFGEFHSTTGRDIWALSPEGIVAKVRVTPYNEDHAVFSPDGRWIAHDSNESGRSEIYVQSYPGEGKRVPVSTRGGTMPRWSHDGKELFYLAGGAMMTVAMRPDGSPASAPRRLFDSSGYLSDSYDVSPDGKRFLMIRPDPGSTPHQLNVILNWSDELDRLVPVGKK